MNKDFINWIVTENKFYNTLVDRIVPGYPRNEANEFQLDLGYQDQNMVVGEIFHLWCIDAQTVEDKAQAKKNLEELKKALPTEKAGLNVLFVDSIVPYKQRKVKILNGSHTALVPVSYLSGIDTVRETIEDNQLGKYVKDFIFDEVIPTIDIPHDQMVAYSNSVLERYMNPYVRHELMSIALNSVTKFKERDLPTVLQYIERTGKLPVHGLFSLAAIISFYKGERTINGIQIALNDDPKFIEFFKNEWAKYDGTKGSARKIVEDTLSMQNAEGTGYHWGQDLNKIAGVTDFVTEALYAQQTMPMRDAIKAIIK
jgi:tagaturonate reductase